MDGGEAESNFQTSRGGHLGSRALTDPSLQRTPMPLEFLGNPPVASDHQVRPFSPAVRAGDFVYVSGQVPAGDNGEIVAGGIEVQTRQVFANIRRVLALAGCTLEDVCKCTVWLDDARDFGAFNRVYMEQFPGPKPARSTTEARLMVDAKVEIEVVAWKPLGR
jgi:reactive intermediate/imine deaminase